MTPQEIRALADSLYKPSVAPVLLALADLYSAAREQHQGFDSAYRCIICRAVERLEELQP